MGKAIRASALVLLFVCSAQAGIMQNGSPEPPPPPQPASTVQEPTAGGEITTGEPATGEMPNGITDIVTQVAWELLAVLPSLL
jgi:ABC-type transport system substrate-binding protein